ncbi:MAG: PEGA domain-containing protein [Polyangiaceae bacterium]|nr:PEGA domain-containing protein [Polyangiaceae bacterium]
MRSGLTSSVCSRPTYSLHRVLRVVLWLGLLCASAIAIQPSAHAQSDKSGEVLLLFRQGQFAARMMDWPRAYKLFKRCYELQPSYDIAANLGQVAVKAGKPAEGALYLWRSLRAFPLSEKAERHRAVELMFQVAKKNVTAVTVTTEPADAQLLVNGADQPRSPSEPVFLDPGQHILTAEAPGYEPYSQPVNAIAGTEVSLTFTLQASPGTAAAPDAAADTQPPELAPEAEPATPESPSPRPAPKPAPAARVVSAGPGPVEDTGETGSGGQRSVWVPLLIGGGVAAIGVTLGIVYTVSAQSTMSEAHDLDHEIGNNSSCVSGRDTDPDRCDRLRTLAEKVDSQRNTSFVAFGIAGAAVAATLGYLLWPTDDKPSAQVRPGLDVGAQHGLVSLSGRF